MALSDRKIQILQAIINDYIETAEPVGSRTIAKKYNLGISSATIRNEMSDLEEMGLILQPHASSGKNSFRYGLQALCRPSDAAEGAEAGGKEISAKCGRARYQSD